MYKTNESHMLALKNINFFSQQACAQFIAPPTTLITQPDNNYSLFDFIRTFFPLSLFDIFNGETFILSIHIYSHLKISKKGSRGGERGTIHTESGRGKQN